MVVSLMRDGLILVTDPAVSRADPPPAMVRLWRRAWAVMSASLERR